MSDVHSFVFEGLPVRGILVRVTDAWQEILRRRASNSEHGPYPAPVAQMLGEMKLWVGSWNMGARDPFMELGDLAANADAAARMLAPFVPLGLDVYVFGVQEGISDKMYEAIEQYTGTFRVPLHTKLYAPRDAKESAAAGGGSGAGFGRSRRMGCAIRVSSLLAEARAGSLPTLHTPASLMRWSSRSLTSGSLSTAPSSS